MVARDPVPAARRLADDLLFPAAAQVDRSERVPAAHLDRLADAGLYGLAGPKEFGGLGADLPALCAAVEALASGCLATTFVWIQHHGLVHSLAAATGDAAGLRDRWLAPLCRGELRAGIALTGLHPGPPGLRAEPDGSGGWTLEGEAHWVTGWDLIDVLQVVARGPGETSIWCAVDARPSPGLRARPLRLAAVNASRTVTLEFRGLPVAPDRVIRVEPYVESQWEGGSSLRTNGSLALGVAQRCCRLIGPSGLDAELDACRARLDAAGHGEMAAARAAASDLAVRAAAGLAVATGSRSVLAGDTAERMTREALFLLVFGSRRAIRTGLRRLLGLAPRPGAAG